MTSDFQAFIGRLPKMNLTLLNMLIRGVNKDFGRIEGATGQRRRVALLLARPDFQTLRHPCRELSRYYTQDVIVYNPTNVQIFLQNPRLILYISIIQQWRRRAKKERKKTEIAFSSAVVVGASAMSYSHNEAQSSSGCNQNAYPVPEIS